MVAKSAKIISPVTALSANLNVAPALVLRSPLGETGKAIAALGKRPLVIGGQMTLDLVQKSLTKLFESQQLTALAQSYAPDCSESSLAHLQAAVKNHQADVIIGIGGGKALDTAKLVAHASQLPVVTIPSSGATCAAWTALSNVYSETGAFLYDVPLRRCPDLLILDYELVQTAPQRTLIAGIGDAIAKWYEASVSSGHSSDTLTIAAVQQARVLRDLLLQKSAEALQNPGSQIWREVVDATVLLAGVIGGLGGANCRTVAAHAVHNGLTQLPLAHQALHGEKVAYGILVQLRLEELLAENQLALSSRQQLLKFYGEIGLPKTLEELGMGAITMTELRQIAEFTCQSTSDIHRLPFNVTPEPLMAAMVSTTGI